MVWNELLNVCVILKFPDIFMLSIGSSIQCTKPSPALVTFALEKWTPPPLPGLKNTLKKVPNVLCVTVNYLYYHTKETRQRDMWPRITSPRIITENSHNEGN
jgi:hypothetical protein